MSKAEMQITRIDSDREMEKPIKTIDIQYTDFNGRSETFRITPDFFGLRIHKSSVDGGLVIEPSCGNEIIIK